MGSVGLSLSDFGLVNAPNFGIGVEPPELFSFSNGQGFYKIVYLDVEQNFQTLRVFRVLADISQGFCNQWKIGRPLANFHPFNIPDVLKIRSLRLKTIIRADNAPAQIRFPTLFCNDDVAGSDDKSKFPAGHSVHYFFGGCLCEGLQFFTDGNFVRVLPQIAQFGMKIDGHDALLLKFLPQMGIRTGRKKPNRRVWVFGNRLFVFVFGRFFFSKISGAIDEILGQ